jgi:hypothetical protein
MVWNRICVVSSTNDSGKMLIDVVSNKACAKASLRAFSRLFLLSPSIAETISASRASKLMPSRTRAARSAFHSGTFFVFTANTST